MLYSKGDRVRYLGKPEWGPGWVLGNSKDGKTRVFFEEVGIKVLVLKYAKLMKVKLKATEDWGPSPFR